MKIIASRELSARPGAVWEMLSEDGTVVVTRDGVPLGILSPTSPETLVEDVSDTAFLRARRAVSQIRQDAAASGRAEMTLDEINKEIRQVRAARRTKKSD
jgi:hypothetical protein